MSTGLDRLNALSLSQAEAEFLKCCGSTRWAREMSECRPFNDNQAIFDAADAIFGFLSEQDWLEAFRAHPKIGERKAETTQTARAQEWSAQEQSGMASASTPTINELSQKNLEYEARFGFIFIVCATGKTPEEMLAMLSARLQNSARRELRVAAGEQKKITRLRLEKLLNQ